jgi:hypothetical protein
MESWQDRFRLCVKWCPWQECEILKPADPGVVPGSLEARGESVPAVDKIVIGSEPA